MYLLDFTRSWLHVARQKQKCFAQLRSTSIMLRLIITLKKKSMTEERKSNKRAKRYFSAKNIVKQLLPPIVITILKKVFVKGFVSYSSWDQAEQASEGYDSNSLIEKVRKAAKLVFDGKAVYERDSVVFDEIDYSYPLLASLLFAAANSESLRVIDFGGGFGTTYQQNRRFLSKLKRTCQWRVVEQEKFVSIGKSEFTNDTLSFYSTIEEAYKDGVDAVIFCGSICYVPNPYIFMEKAKTIKAPYVIFDRTPTTNLNEDTFAVQYVPLSVFKASFPIRNFSYNNITKYFKDEYELIAEWVCDLQADPNTTAMGFIFKRKSN